MSENYKFKIGDWVVLEGSDPSSCNKKGEIKQICDIEKGKREWAPWYRMDPETAISWEPEKVLRHATDKEILTVLLS